MNDGSILLSISMLISGREEMKKSLDSLHYFTDEFPCEIILVDTGCSPEYRALAEQYTDKIYDFEWCDDFAAARNVGLRAAKGQWFLYLDDDEWFENPREIINFFKSGEYKQYNSAGYIVRNYFDRQGTIYEDAPVSRMIKVENDTIFRGKIHEYLYPFRLPVKYFTDFVHHYGYAYKSDDEKKKHSERNIKPLIEMIEKEPEDPRWASQLAQEYFGMNRYQETVEVCEKELAQWNKTEDKPPYVEDKIGAIYGFLLISLESMGKYDLEKQKLEEAFCDEDMMDATIAFFHFAAIRLYSKTGEMEKCQGHIRHYLTYYHDLKENPEKITEQTALITSSVFQDRLMYPALLMGMESLIRMEDLALAREAFGIIDWSDKHMLYQFEEEKKLIDACCSVSYHPLWVEMLQTLVSREDGIKEMYIAFLEMEIAYKKDNETEKLSRLRRLVAELEYDHKYILYTKILWTAENPNITSDEERRQTVTELFAQLFADHGSELFDIKTEVWNVAETLEIPLEPMFLQVEYRVWKRALENWLLGVSLEEIDRWDDRLSLWKTVADIRYDIFALRCLEGRLRQCEQSLPTIAMLEAQLWQYRDAVFSFYGPYYTELAFDKMTMMLPDEVQLALGLQELEQARKNGTDQDVIRALREMKDVYPPLNQTIAHYTKLFRQEVKDRNTEMQKLAGTLKDKVRQMIADGSYAEAKAIITQLEQFIPEDEELQEMKRSLE